MQAFEQIMETDADYRAGLNLVVCCFAIGDKERMKQAFVRLAHVRPGCCKLLDELHCYRCAIGNRNSRAPEGGLCEALPSLQAG